MSATETNPQAAQTTDRHAIIVSHGQPSNPDIAEVELAHLSQNIRALMPGWTIHSATLAAPDALEKALQKAGPTPVIYPLFMTDGWFTQSVLPKRIGTPTAHILPPLGVDPSLPDLAHIWLKNILSKQNWQPDQTGLIIAAHGSGRSRNSARDTKQFADAVGQRMGFSDIRLGFIEEHPYLRDAVSNAGVRSVVLPFFASRREHVLDDIPAALNAAQYQGICLDPIGMHADVPMIIADALIRQTAQT